MRRSPRQDPRRSALRQGEGADRRLDPGNELDGRNPSATTATFPRNVSSPGTFGIFSSDSGRVAVIRHRRSARRGWCLPSSAGAADPIRRRGLLADTRSHLGTGVPTVTSLVASHPLDNSAVRRTRSPLVAAALLSTDRSRPTSRRSGTAAGRRSRRACATEPLAAGSPYSSAAACSRG
jgi:hypothetical protein